MRKGFLLMILTGMALAALGVGSGPEDEAAIRAVVSGIYAGFNQHDAKAIADLCADSLDTWEASREGRDAVEEWIGEMVPGAQAGTAKELEEIGIRFITDDVAIQKSRREVTGQVDADGKFMPPQKQLFLRVFVKKDGRWLLRGFFPAPETDD